MKKETVFVEFKTNKRDFAKKVPLYYIIFQKTKTIARVLSIYLTSLLLFLCIFLGACTENPQVKKARFLYELQQFIAETQLNAQAFSNDTDWVPFDQRLAEQQTSYQKYIHLMNTQEKDRVAALFRQYHRIKGTYYARRVEERLELIKSGIRELLTPNTSP